MNDYEVMMRALIEFFEGEGWTIDLERWEAVASSGYGSGPIVIDLNKLVAATLAALRGKVA